MKWLTLVVCDPGRERLGGLSRVRPQCAGRPTVALRETQESPNLPVLHGEKDLELPAGVRHRRGTFCCLLGVLWKSCLTASLLFCPSAAHCQRANVPRLLFNCALMETTTPVTDVSRL